MWRVVRQELAGGFFATATARAWPAEPRRRAEHARCGARVRGGVFAVASLRKGHVRPAARGASPEVRHVAFHLDLR